MPSVYGAWTPSSSSNQRMRLRIDYSASTTASAVAVSGSVYVEAGYSFNDSSNTFAVSGNLAAAFSGSKNVNVGSGGSQKLHDFSGTIPRGSSDTSRSLAASLTGINYVSGTATVSLTVTAPAIPAPVAVPNTPWSLAVARSSDTRHTITWEVTAPTGKPIDSIVIQRYRRGSGSSAYVTVATLAGTARAWVDTSTAANDIYDWRIITRNAAGASAPAYTGSRPTTPAAPSNLVAERSGNDVVLRWSRNAVSASRTDIQKQYVLPGGAWSAWENAVTNLSGDAWTYALSGLDGSRVWRFRVQAVSLFPPSTQLVGNSIASGSVQPLAAPQAPTLLAPTGNQRTGAVSWTWRHNPTDTTAQTAYELQYREVGASAWGALASGSSTSAQSTTVTVSAAGLYEWRARTRGLSSTWSDWSAPSVVGVYSPPEATIVAPVDGDVGMSSNRVVLRWDFEDASGAAQTAFRAELLDSDGAVLETILGTSSKQAAFRFELQNLTAYAVRVTVTSGTGITSAPETATFATDFIPPPEASISPSWAEETGLVSLTISNVMPTGSVPPAVSNRIERSDDAGTTWVTVADDLPVDAEVSDWQAPLNSTPLFRAVAISDLGVETLGTAVQISTPSSDLWLTTDTGASCRIELDLALQVTYGQARVIEDYLGAPLPEAHYGDSRPVQWRISGALIEGRGIEQDWRTLLGRDCYLREPGGQAMWVSIQPDGVSHSSQWIKERSVTLTADAVQHE